MIDHDRSIWETISRYNVPIKNKLLEFRMEFRISCWDLGPSRSLVHLTLSATLKWRTHTFKNASFETEFGKLR